MVLTILLIIIVAAALGSLGWLFWRKWEQLQLLDPGSLPDAQSRKLKYDILRQRVSRTSDKYVKKARQDVVAPLSRKVQEGIRRVAGKLTAAERSYQKRKRMSGVDHVDKETVRAMLQQAKDLYEQQEWDRAEKLYIEVISSSPRNAEAYEYLGWLYFEKKEYDLALETWMFLNKLTPDDASVVAALGEVEQIRGNVEVARTYFQRAVKLQPNNPKYLDLFIEVLIELKDVHEATATLDRLRESNPENKKIDVFEQRIKEVRERIVG